MQMAGTGFRVAGLLLSVIAFLLGANRAGATSFELMQIEQVIGGVDGDPTAQAIQLRMRAGAQNLVSQAKLVVYDAAGLNPITIVDLTTDAANAASGDHVLIASGRFAYYTSDPLAADFTMTNLIPTNYLAAGRLAYQGDDGTNYWSVSWGGASYTGANTGSTLNDADGNFGPPFTGPLPTNVESAVLFTNSETALSRSNVVDYVLTAGAAVFSNNLRQAFTVVPHPQITAFAREASNLRLTWATRAGRTNYVQVTSGTAGSYTNNFTNLSPLIVASGTGNVVTNYLDVGGATNLPARYYRIRLIP
jgi:hypothetical protein